MSKAEHGMPAVRLLATCQRQPSRCIEPSAAPGCRLKNAILRASSLPYASSRMPPCTHAAARMLPPRPHIGSVLTLASPAAFLHADIGLSNATADPFQAQLHHFGRANVRTCALSARVKLPRKQALASRNVTQCNSNVPPLQYSAQNIAHEHDPGCSEFLASEFVAAVLRGHRCMRLVMDAGMFVPLAFQHRRARGPTAIC